MRDISVGRSEADPPN